MKKTLLCVLYTLLACFAVQMVEASTYTDSDGFTWYYKTNSDGTNTITLTNSTESVLTTADDWTGETTSLTVPATFTVDDTEYTITQLGMFCFANCFGLESVDLSACTSLTALGTSCFQKCTSLTSITLPKSITSLGTSCFNTCSALTSIDLSDCTELTAVAMYVLANCTSLESVILPSSITSLGNYCFYGCTGLESVTLTEESQLTTLGNAAFMSCSSLKEITIPASVSAVGLYVFAYCSALESVTFEDGCKLDSIGHMMFTDCTSLKEISIPDSVTKVGDYAFYYCTSLHKVSIPEDVASVGYAAFDFAYALDTLICYPEDVPSAGVDAFEDAGKNVDGGTRVFTPPYSLQAYAADATNSNAWQAFADSQYYPFAEEKVSSAHVATLALPFDATIPTGVTLSTLETLTEAENDDDYDEVTGETVSTTTLGKDTPVLVSGAEAKYQYFGVEDATVEGVVSDRSAVPTKGFLTGVYAADGTTIYTTDGNYTNYVLQAQTYGTMFYKVRSAGELVGQFRAYLQIDDSTTEEEAESISFVLGGTATGIAAVETAGSGEAGVYYDLQGRRVLNPQKGGIYIKDGRKVLL